MRHASFQVDSPLPDYITSTNDQNYSQVKWRKVWRLRMMSDADMFLFFTRRWMTITMEWWTIARIDKAALQIEAAHHLGPMHEPATTWTVRLTTTAAATATIQTTVQVRTVRLATTRCWRVVQTMTTWTVTASEILWDLRLSMVHYWTAQEVGTVLTILCSAVVSAVIRVRNS